MKEKWICLYRRKTGKCLWQAICEMNHQIKTLKQYEVEYKNRIKQLENAIQEKGLQIEASQIQFIELGRSTKKQIALENEKVPEKCIYQRYDCVAVYHLKKRVQNHHFQKQMALIEHYNQRVMLIRNIFNDVYDNHLLKAVDALMIVYEKTPYLMMGYTLTQAQMIKDLGEVAFIIFYIVEGLKVAQISMKLNVFQSKEVLKNTYLTPKPNAYLIEVTGNESFKSALYHPILNWIEDWVVKWNTCFGDSFFWIEGWYSPINQKERANSLGERADLHYQTIGRIEDGKFKSNQLILWRIERGIH